MIAERLGQMRFETGRIMVEEPADISRLHRAFALPHTELRKINPCPKRILGFDRQSALKGFCCCVEAKPGASLAEFEPGGRKTGRCLGRLLEKIDRGGKIALLQTRLGIGKAPIRDEIAGRLKSFFEKR